MSIGQYNNTWMPNYWSGGWTWNMPYQQPNNQGNNIQQQQPINNLLRVTGPESAKAYSIPPNSNVVLFDADNPIFYLKSTDDSGFANLRTFKFEEQKVIEVQPQVEQNSNSVTKNDLEALEKDISELKEMLEGLVN